MIRITEINILKQTKGDICYIPIIEDSESSLLSLSFYNRLSRFYVKSAKAYIERIGPQETLTFKGNWWPLFKVSMQWRLP